jgi:hypothetical protein
MIYFNLSGFDEKAGMLLTEKLRLDAFYKWLSFMIKFSQIH